jgi:hypothetical protein
MRSPRTFPLVAAALVLALVAALVLTRAGGDDPSQAATPTPIRADPAVGPFQGLGAWVDLYDEAAWADPPAAVADMAAHGVHTLYLETSNFNRDTAFVDEAGVTAFLDAGAAEGVQVVAWFLPGFVDVATDTSRSQAAVAFTTPAGNRFAGFALDIESLEVKDLAARTQRLVELSNALRAEAGQAYPLGAIVPSPKAMKVNDYWPGFPWAQVAQTYDAILPMTYFTFRVHGLDDARAYASTCIRLLRTWVGNDLVPIHMIGGIAQDATAEETSGFVQAVREYGLLGASYYTWPGITDEQWSALAPIPANPVGDPALPVPPGPRELGNIPGSDTTHPWEVVYRTNGRAGDRMLSFEAYGPGAGEVSIVVNGTTLGTVTPSPGVWAPQSLLVPDDAFYADAPNVVAFVVTGDGVAWGVRNVSILRA